MKKLLASIIIVLTVIIGVFTAFADEEVYYVICNPKSHINVRLSAKRNSAEIGWLECGDIVYADGKKKNGFMHCFPNVETGEGWVYAGYLVDEQPIVYGGTAIVRSNGRVACRQYVNGKRQGWLKTNQRIMVLAYTTEWALTKKGFVKTVYLEFENE